MLIKAYTPWGEVVALSSSAKNKNSEAYLTVTQGNKNNFFISENA